MAIETEGLIGDGIDALDERSQALIQKWIEPNPHRSGADNVRLREHGVPVWALIGHARATGRSAEEVARDYAVPTEAVEAALAYYRQYQAVIDNRIAANAA